jgi:molecular chaperone DnaK
MNILVGIDFGTTNTVISIFDNNKSKPLLDGVYRTIPSKIGRMNGKFYCGNYIPLACTDIIHSFKTTIGTTTTFILDGETFSHTDLLVLFFKHIYDLIIKYIECDNITKVAAVITVPSNFIDMQREIIRSSFISVGIDVIRIINEPSAAALAYGMNHSTNAEEKILVIDTGGGTMDFTILQKTDLFFEVIHSEGLNDLGGNNFTELIVNDMKRSRKEETSMLSNTVLWLQAQKIKEKLTYLESYEIKLNVATTTPTTYFLNKTRFENLSNPLIEKMGNVLENIMANYNTEKSRINYVILVGGTSRIPILHETIKKITKMTPWIHPNLETVVSEGAGLYCGIIENKFTLTEDVVLLDVVPLSLGVELVDGTYSVIIPKNTPLPVKRNQRYTTDSPSDSTIKIKIYQGERIIANKNSLIGEFIFDKVSMGGVPIIDISFKVDMNSIINVTVIDRKSGIEKTILIKDIPTIDSSMIDKLLEQANAMNSSDQEELGKAQNIYLIRTHIENALINLQVNNIIDINDKNDMIQYFNKIEEGINEMNNLQLVEILNEMTSKYSVLGNAMIDNDEPIMEIDKMFFEERKRELKNRIDLLLIKNPKLDEFLNPVLEQLSYNTVTEEYVKDKLEFCSELDSEQNTRDYKMELNNLCLYLKNEIECGNMNGESLLIELINSRLDMILHSTNIDWEEQINIFNKKCEEIYNLTNS